MEENTFIKKSHSEIGKRKIIEKLTRQVRSLTSMVEYLSAVFEKLLGMNAGSVTKIPQTNNILFTECWILDNIYLPKNKPIPKEFGLC